MALQLEEVLKLLVVAAMKGEFWGRLRGFPCSLVSLCLWGWLWNQLPQKGSF